MNGGGKGFSLGCGAKLAFGFWLIGGLVVLIASVTLPNYVHATASRDYNTCLAESRAQDVGSVRGACEEWATYTTNNECALWLGDSYDQALQTITVENKDAEWADITYWGMCTNYSAYVTRVFVWDNEYTARYEVDSRGPEYVNNQFTAINTNPLNNFERSGTWGWPNSYQTTMNVAEFKNGITPERNGDYLEYKRTLYMRQSYYYWEPGYEYTQTWPGSEPQKNEIVLKIRSPLTLTGYAVTTEGAYLNNSEPICEVSVYYGNSVECKANDIEGYSFVGWSFLRPSAVGYSTLPGSSSTYKDSSFTDDDPSIIYAIYRLENKFQGRARVDNGTSVNTNSASSTKYVDVDTSVNRDVDCTNEGCNVTFDLYAKIVQGNGAMNYSVGTTRNWTSDTWSETDSVVPYDLNTTSHNYKIKEETIKLQPGQNMCKILRFTPKSASRNTVDVEACANTTVSTFEGQSLVSGDINGAVGFTDSNSSRTFYAENCNDGCTVTFTHKMQRTRGIGSSDGWVVSRDSNLEETERGIQSNSNVISGDFDLGTDASKNGQPSTVNRPKESVFTLYPGMKVCEKLTFKPSNTVVNAPDVVYTEVCALALGNAQPDDPGSYEGNDAFIDLEVKKEKNDNVTGDVKYGTFQRVVYAKPGDNLTYRAYYNPTLQYTYHLKLRNIKIDQDPIKQSSAKKTLGQLYNTYKGSNLGEWNNAFSVQKKFNSNDDFNGVESINDYKYDNGLMRVDAEDNSVKVTGEYVGQSIDERAVTNLNRKTWTTPGQVKFDCSNKEETRNGEKRCTGNNIGNVITDPRSSIAYARVPYNFTTDAEITTDESTLIFAGESVSMNAQITIKPKSNAETMDEGESNYATKVGNPKYKLIVYKGNRHNGGVYDSDDLCRSAYDLRNNGTSCGYSAEVSGDDAKNNINGTKNDDRDPSIKLHEDNVKSTGPLTFYAQDLTAGSEICVAIAFWPATSGTDTNYSDPDGDHKWRVSPSKCYKVAKKPSLQVWGGNIYSTGKIDTAVAEKYNVYNYTTNYNASSVSAPNQESKYVFGSWGELGLISVGEVTGFASGAKTGYALNNNGTLWPSYIANSNNTLLTLAPGGSTESSTGDICIRSTLTLANYPCNPAEENLPPGNLGGDTVGTNGERDKNAIIANFMKETTGGDNSVSGNVSLNDDSKINDLGAYYYKGSGSLTVGGIEVGKGTTQIVHAANGGNITITGNLTYPAEGYTTLSDIPKLVLYAEGNIYINCDVTRIDAMLIADGSVTTCGTATSVDEANNTINNPENSNQLIINGTIIADKLIANRTYGAATGANSIIPAEIINYDATLYLWGANKASVVESGKIRTTYIEELSPRL